ncbi:hypothetical protein TON_1350 [Thermococcus onnurineus NA1]|uniref:DUF2178 domain-containing protein n=1 Tax=Thermococcus onnurineus (strain NA1) TaxID=523850 RepID=B6YXM7_THEON|nr:MULTISPECIES: DUF2178 domain-containing protein [Thermococcus]ACJ16840.1 hypothetical protein TON_1350 [Thermococcus onnurineus NA1]NJE46814.1 DUF2178 domain-containing protein [Thermococcus sp. GR7]NJE79623.1 DUF2178 domain-containing protein [Thermococcus sp. GR4]NJF23392.1 DUF2178 domain-containing protein [Thermococcus sp. GR5]
MNELALVSLVALIGGGFLGYFMMRTIVENTGVPIDERGLEISKLAAMRTLELVLLVTVLSLYYSWLVLRDERCTNLSSLIFATIFFGNLAFRAYYSRKM